MEKTGMLTNSITTFSCADGINLYIGTSSGLYCMNTETKEISLLRNLDMSGKVWMYITKIQKNEFICLPKTDCLMIIYGQSLKIKKKTYGLLPTMA